MQRSSTGEKNNFKPKYMEAFPEVLEFFKNLIKYLKKNDYI